MVFRPPRALAAVAASVALLAGCTTGEDSTELVLADSYSTTHPFATLGVEGFIASVEGAGIAIDYYPSGQMGNPRDIVSLNRAGVLDITPASPAYLSDQLPLSSVTDLPGLTDDSCAASAALTQMLAPGGILYETEYQPRGLRPLWVAILPSYEVMTVGTEVRSPDDLRGLTIRTSGGAMDATLEALGAAPVSMPAADAYEALTRRTVDGVSFPYISVLPYRLQEVLGYSTQGLNAGSFAIPYVISEAAWSELSAEEQDALTEAGREASSSLCVGINEGGPEAGATMAEDGVTFEEIEGSQAEEFDAILGPVRDQWAADMDAWGRPGTEVLETYEQLIDEYERGQ